MDNFSECLARLFHLQGYAHACVVVHGAWVVVHGAWVVDGWMDRWMMNGWMDGKTENENGAPCSDLPRP